MTITNPQFRANFPEFQSDQVYPDATLDMWLGYAYALVSPTRWAALLDLGAQLFTAHMLVLSQQAQEESAAGNPPGLATGMITAQSVDKVSESYDVQSVLNDKAGHWNLTTYGLRFVQMGRMFGAGPIQVNGGGYPFPGLVV